MRKRKRKKKKRSDGVRLGAVAMSPRFDGVAALSNGRRASRHPRHVVDGVARSGDAGGI